MLVRARRVPLEQASDPAIAMVRHLLRLRGVAEMSARLLTMERFSWRRFRNCREVAGIRERLVPRGLMAIADGNRASVRAARRCCAGWRWNSRGAGGATNQPAL